MFSFEFWKFLEQAFYETPDNMAASEKNKCRLSLLSCARFISNHKIQYLQERLNYKTLACNVVN